MHVADVSGSFLGCDRIVPPGFAGIGHAAPLEWPNVPNVDE
ncbi:hypothetical protein [Mycobacterium asiaticum]|nr:hypothetical protein [Mycobacterium asiaticum]